MSYYRERIECHEHERKNWYRTLDALRIPQEYVHKIEWESKKRGEEILELERMLK